MKQKANLLIKGNLISSGGIGPKVEETTQSQIYSHACLDDFDISGATIIEGDVFTSGHFLHEGIVLVTGHACAFTSNSNPPFVGNMYVNGNIVIIDALEKGFSLDNLNKLRNDWTSKGRMILNYKHCEHYEYSEFGNLCMTVDGLKNLNASLLVIKGSIILK